MQLILCSLIIITLLTTIVLHFAYQEYVEFLEPIDAFEEIKYDPFFRRMSPFDLFARKSISKNEYMGKYRNALKPFTILEKMKMIDLIRQANSYIYQYPNLHNIPWRIIKLRAGLECNMPHTIGSVIVINERNINSPEILDNLIHEKIHIYQKQFLEQTDILIKQWGFKQTNTQNIFLRNNPDTDNQIYLFNGTTMATIYASKEPKDIKDVVILADSKKLKFSDKIYEASHPHEIMAYELTQIILGGCPSESLKNTDDWMLENL